MKQLLFILSIFLTAGCTGSKDKPVKTDLLSTLPQYVRYEKSSDAFCIAAAGKATTLCVSPDDWEGVIRAAGDLQTISATFLAPHRNCPKAIRPRPNPSL